MAPAGVAAARRRGLSEAAAAAAASRCSRCSSCTPGPTPGTALPGGRLHVPAEVSRCGRRRPRSCGTAALPRSPKARDWPLMPSQRWAATSAAVCCTRCSRCWGCPQTKPSSACRNAEIILPRGSGRYQWPHALLQEHLLARLMKRPDAKNVFIAAADSLAAHPLSNTRRIVRQRVANLLSPPSRMPPAGCCSGSFQNAWLGAREPLATLGDLELLKGHLQGRSLALKHRWQAEALRHLGRPEEATTHAEIAREHFEELDDKENLAHTLRLLGHLASEKGASGEGVMLVDLAHQIFTELGNVLGQAQCEAVIGEIEYLLGNYERARAVIEAGESHSRARSGAGARAVPAAPVLDRSLGGRDGALAASDAGGARRLRRRLPSRHRPGGRFTLSRRTPPDELLQRRAGRARRPRRFRGSAHAARPRRLRAAARDDRHRHGRPGHGRDPRGSRRPHLQPDARSLGHPRIPRAVHADRSGAPGHGNCPRSARPGSHHPSGRSRAAPTFPAHPGLARDRHRRSGRSTTHWKPPAKCSGNARAPGITRRICSAASHGFPWPEHARQRIDPRKVFTNFKQRCDLFREFN